MKIISVFTKFLSIVLLLSGFMACGSSDTFIEIVIPEVPETETTVFNPSEAAEEALTPEPSPTPSPNEEEEPLERSTIPDCPEGPLPAYNCKTVHKGGKDPSRTPSVSLAAAANTTSVVKEYMAEQLAKYRLDDLIFDDNNAALSEATTPEMEQLDLELK